MDRATPPRAGDGNATRFLAVRFGNVLASSRQRRSRSSGARSPAAGPVTVTHPEMTRYFMTIPEAAQLIIQAGAIGESGDVFVLDMGEPVKIVDLAHNMIRLLGQGAGARHRDRVHRRPAGREAARGAVGRRRGADSHLAPEDLPRVVPSTRPVWLENELAELGQLIGGRRHARGGRAAGRDGARRRSVSRSRSKRRFVALPGRRAPERK